MVAGIAQRNTRLNGVDYVPGDAVPGELCTRGNVRLGLVTIVPDSAAQALREVEADAFDPAEHTVPEVIDFARAHPESLDEIRDQEVRGKNRSTALAKLDELAEDDGDGEDADGGGADEVPGAPDEEGERGPVKKPLDPDAPAPEVAESFDPSEHTVPEVIDHAEANRTEVGAIRLREVAGRNRGPLLSALASIEAEPPPSE